MCALLLFGPLCPKTLPIPPILRMCVNVSGSKDLLTGCRAVATAVLLQTLGQC